MKPTLLDYIFLFVGIMILIILEVFVNKPSVIQYIAAVVMVIIYIKIKE